MTVTMRISTVWAQQRSVSGMSAQQSKLYSLQQQLSSGLKVSVPEDNPSAAAQILDFNKIIAKTSQYQANIATTRGRLNIEESALATTGDVLDRAKELTISAMNDTLNSSDRLGIKNEIDQLIEQLAGVANTQNANGEFIFSGNLSGVPAFVKNAVSGNYDYQGASEQRTLQIGPTRQVADGDLGVNVFSNIKSSSPAADENGNRSVFNTLKALSDALGANLNATPAQITGSRFARYGLDYTSSPTQFDLVGTGGVTASIDLTGQKFANIDSVVTEINAQIGAGGLGGDIQARNNGNNIEFVSVATGATSSIQINNTTGTFLTDAGFTDGQSMAGANAQTFQSQLGNVLTDLDTARNSILDIRASIGTRLNNLTDQESQNDKFILDTKTTLSQTQDLDYADALSKFQLQSTALQAAMQAYGTVKQLSLFNYL